MKKLLWGISVMLLHAASFAQPAGTPGNGQFEQPYLVDTLSSTALQQKRMIKVHLPAGFKPAGKYPVFFVLDENWMFEPAVTEVRKLTEFGVIPPCIVVGINSPNRSLDLTPNLSTGALTATNQQFLEYLTKEVPQHIARKYAPSAFSILVGHSDGATFAQNAMTHQPDAFRGVICLSQNLFGNALNEYVQYSRRDFTKRHYFFVASGTSDATPRLRSGMQLDSVFRAATRPLLKTDHRVYDADHSGVAALGLTQGMAFIFSDYGQPNDWNRLLIDSLKKLKMDPVALIENTMKTINDNYGIDAVPGSSGVLSLAFAIISSKEQAAAYLGYKRAHTPASDQFNSSAAQLYERIAEYDTALVYWTRYLHDPQSYKNHFFYYRRPIELLAYKMNDPQRAILFTETWEKTAPDAVKLSFRFFLAKVAADKNVQVKKGRAAIDYFIKNYDPAKTQYSLEDAQKIKQQLAGNTGKTR